MSEKSKGDTSQQSSTSSLLQQQQRIVKNPLLSANVTGLTFDDFPNKPLLLPAAPPIVKPPALLREPKSLVTVGSSSNLDSENLDEINLNAVGEQPPSSSLFAQQSAGLESSASAEANANQIWEQHSALNNDSILSQAAVSFSALPSVASSVFSTFSKRIYAGSSASSRERTPVTDTPASQANDSNQNPLQQQQQQLPPLQQQQQQQQVPQLQQQKQQLPPLQQQQQQVPQLQQQQHQQLPPTFYPPPTAVGVTPHAGVNPAPLLAPPPENPEPPPTVPLEPPTFYSPSEVPTLGVAPPSQPPAAASGNTYRLSAKKKLYAPIPGLADGAQQQPFVTPLQPLEQSSFLPPLADSYGPAAFSGQDPYGGVAVQQQQQQQYPLEPQTAFTERRAPEERKTGGLFSLTSGVLQNLTGLVQSAAGTLTGSQTSSTPPHQQQHQQQQYSAPSAVDYFGGIAPPQPTSFITPSEGLTGVSYPPAAVGGAPPPTGGLSEPPKANPAAFFGAGPIPLSTAPPQSQAPTTLAGAPFLSPPTSTAPQQPQQATGLSSQFQHSFQQQPQLQQFLPPPLQQPPLQPPPLQQPTLQPPPLQPPQLQQPLLQQPPLQPPPLQQPPEQPPPPTGQSAVPTSVQSLFTPALGGESSTTPAVGGAPSQLPSASVFPPRPPSTGAQSQAPQEVQPPPTFFSPPNTNPLQTPPQPQGGAQYPPSGQHPPAPATGHPPPPATGHPPPAAGSTSFRLQKGTRLYKNPLSSEETAPSYAAPPPLLGLTATPAGAQSFFNPFQGHQQQSQGDTAEEAPTTHSVPSYFIPTSSEPQSVPLFVAEDKGDTPSVEQDLTKGINDLLAGVKDLEIESLDAGSSLAEQTIEAFVPVEDKETPTPQPAVDPLDLTLQQLAQEPQQQQAEPKQQQFEPQQQLQQQFEPQQQLEPQKQQLEPQQQQLEPQQQFELQQQQFELQQQQQLEQQQQLKHQQQQLGQLFGQQPQQQLQQIFGKEEQQQFASQHLSQQQETFGQQQLPEVEKQQAPQAEVPQEPIPTSKEQFDSAPLPTEQPVQSIPPSTPDKPSISSLPPTGSLPPPPPPFGQSSGDTSSNPYKRKSLVGTHPPPAGPPLSTLQNFFTPITGDTGGDTGGFNFFATPPTLRQDEPVAAAPPADPINFFQPSVAAEPRPSAPPLPQFVETPIEAAKQTPETVLTAPPPIGFDNIAGEVRQAESCPPQGFSNFFTQTSNIPASQTQNFIPAETNPLGQPQVKDPHSFFDSFTVTRPDGVEATPLSSNSSQCSFFQPLAGDDQQQQQQQQSSKEYQSLQNFFNNPPPKESTGEAGDLNYDLVHSGLGVKDLVQRSLTPASNLVEPPSSSCSELSLNTSKREELATETATSSENPATTSSENTATTRDETTTTTARDETTTTTRDETTTTTREETTTTTRDETTTTTNEIFTTTTINDDTPVSASTNDDLGTNNWSFVKHYGELPEEILQDLRAMAKNDTGAASSSSPPVVPYTPAVKHWFYRRVIDSKFVWFPFSHYDNALLETSLMSGDPEQNIVAVEGGRYDANIRERHKTPVYWDGEPLAVRRCSWFYKGSDSKYVPYEEEVADLLEAEYKLAVEKNEWHKKIILSQGEQVTLHGPTVIVHFHQQQNSDAWGGTTQVTNRPRVVKRDLDDFNIDQGESQRVDHLLLMVHGIGSACDLKMRSVEEVVDEFRSIAQQLVKSHYKNSTDLGQVGRVEVLPISWHFHLHSLESGIDEKLKSITLESIPRLRNFTNDTLLDVLFYTSPMYCQKIMNTVATAMNETYLKYRERHPEFSGGVSLAGHSLGSLILFDLLCHQHPIKELEDANVENPDEMYGLAHAQLTKATDPSPSCAHEEQVQYTMGPAGTGQPFIHYTQLAFQPKKFFALGSPIGMFVTIRGIDTLGLDFRLPTCAGFYNIFHPFDPVAYRIEALINPDMSGVRPVLVPHHKGRKRMHLELKETMTRVGADLKQRFLDTVKTTIGSVNFLGTSSMASAGGKKEEDAIKEEVEKVLTMQMQMDSSSSEQLPKQRNRTDSTSTLQSDESMVEIDVPLGKLNDSKRVDYVLQEAPLEIINEYIFALSSHVCYWESEDTILFVMKEIYTGLGITPDSQVPQQSMTIERPNSQNS